jgi:hypothetical protein
MQGQFKLCPDLRPADVCLVVEQYREGGFERRFHKHVPRERLSDDARLDLLRALVARFLARTGPNAEQIIGSYLNTNIERPVAPNGLTVVTSHPEPGVVRCYCGSATVAWSDHVFARRQFRLPQGARSDEIQQAAGKSEKSGGPE